MALPIRQQLTYWGITTVVFLLLLWALGDVLMPFILGGAVAYFLDPVADKLERMGLSRVAATAVITLAGILVFLIVTLLVVPTLIGQTVQLANVAPEYARSAAGSLTERFPSLLDENSTLRQSIQSLGETIRSRGVELIETALTSALSVVNVLVLIVIVPVVSVYLLLDWDNMIARIDDLLPRDHVPTIRKLASEVDSTLSSFIRGMGTVCLILGSYYAIALMLAGLQFGLVVGFIAGLVTFIPYLGALIGGALAIGLALFQFWGEWVNIAIIAGIFMVGQVVEGNILTPKLVGSSVGLHPVWLLLALSVFGALFGFVGMLVAVPVAAALGVFARFGAEQYRNSMLYRGMSEGDRE